MPFPVDIKWITQTEEKLGVRFPASFVTAMSKMNGMYCTWSGIRILVPPGRSVTVGRRPDCDVVLSSPVVGSRAFRLHDIHGCLVLEDVHSKLQITVNGVPLAKGAAREIFEGDRIEFGCYCFVVEPNSTSGANRGDT